LNCDFNLTLDRTEHTTKTPRNEFHLESLAMASGLTRRRGAGGGGNTENGDGDDVGRVSSPAPRNNNSDVRSPETSYESGENGHRIAFDPRDISESAERSKQPKLTLMEEVLLMGLKDKQGYLSFWNDNISYALRGCIVIELAFRGRIAMEKDSNRRRFPLADRTIEVVDDSLTGEVLLDEALKMMKSSEKMSVASWIDLMSGEYESVRTGLWYNFTYYIRPLTRCLHRRDMESHENRLPAQAGSRAACEGPR
jgi:hypothetical protein